MILKYFSEIKPKLISNDSFLALFIVFSKTKASQANVRQLNSRKSVQTANMKTRGAMIMKTVSILIVNSRRICNQSSKDTTTKNGKTRNRPNKMDDSIGKPTPKILETLKRKTHFSKLVYFIIFQLLQNCIM